jgi:hypothetical protein
MTERVDKAESVRNFYRRQGATLERKRILALIQERGLKLETEVSDGDGWSLGRHDEIIFVTKLIEGLTDA